MQTYQRAAAAKNLKVDIGIHVVYTRIMQFKKATKAQARLRLALDGPSGSGKTYTSLAVGSALGPKVAMIDTEHGSGSKYADRFNFDTLELRDHGPLEYIKGIRAAEQAGYDVLIIDSLSHAWTGRGGALELVNRQQRTERNSFAAWRTVTPQHNQLIDSMLACRCHLIATMRTKTEWVLEEDERGKKVPRKVGMAAVQRDGMEYEFDVVGDLDAQHVLRVSKTRCAELDSSEWGKPGSEFAGVLKAWLSDGVEPPAPQASPLDTILEAFQEFSGTREALQQLAKSLTPRLEELNVEEREVALAAHRDKMMSLAAKAPPQDLEYD